MKKRKVLFKLTLGIFIMLLSQVPVAVMAQQTTVSGKVTDSSGESLIGVSVLVKGTSTGTVTDLDGGFNFQLPTNAKVLVFSYIGYSTQEIAIGNQHTFNIQLKESIHELEEVIAVGYGIQKKTDLTGATNRITEKDMNKSTAISPIEMMQGRVPGVNITQNNGEPGGGMTVRIRGSNSIRSGQDPLYVVDGVPLDNADLTPTGGTAAGYGSGASKNPLSFLNPEDIESIDILKDASSTAIYGARAANGVVIITTKKGKAGKSVITYDGYTGVSQIRQKMDVLSAAQFRSYTKADGTKLLDQGASTDWQNAIFQNAFTQSHNVSYSGGNEVSTFHSSLSYLDEQGIVKSTGVQKLNANISLTQKAFNNKLNLSELLVVTHQQDNRAPITEQTGAGYEGDLILSALKANPTYPIYNADGTFHQQASTTDRNPVAMLNLVNDITLTDRVLANMSAEIELLKGLKYKLNLGFDRTNAERRVNQNNQLNYLANKGEANINNITANNSLIENYITYLANIGKDHSFNFLLGQSYQNVLVTGHNVDVFGFTVTGIKYTDNLGYGKFSEAKVSSTAYQHELQSFFGRANYSYLERYLFTFTGRYDGSSRFGANKKYGFFPSVAGAWRITEEDFMKDMNQISNLKLRLGWGITGNQEIPDKVSLISVGTSTDANGFFNGQLLPGITFQRTPNPDIQWESTAQSNLGLDVGFFKSRLSGTIDLFSKQTTHVLLEITSQAPAATQTQWENVPGLVISNTGLELGLTGVLIDKKDLNWNVTVNFATTKNQVKGLSADILTGVASGQGLTGTDVQVVSNGQPIGTFFGQVFQGFDSKGLSTYQLDSKGVPVLTYLGNALPDFTYSLSSGLQFKRFDVSMFWYGSQGNKVYNNTANALFGKVALNNGSNVTQAVLNSSESTLNSNAFSSRFIEDGSFIRLSNVTLGYTFNTRSISWLTKVRVYATGNNLLLITKYKGFDPEVNVNAALNGVPSLGMDYTTFPKSRTFTVGVNLQF